jgi:hypothetical protein
VGGCWKSFWRRAVSNSVDHCVLVGAGAMAAGRGMLERAGCSVGRSLQSHGMRDEKAVLCGGRSDAAPCSRKSLSTRRRPIGDNAPIISEQVRASRALSICGHTPLGSGSPWGRTSASFLVLRSGTASSLLLHCADGLLIRVPRIRALSFYLPDALVTL